MINLVSLDSSIVLFHLVLITLHQHKIFNKHGAPEICPDYMKYNIDIRLITKYQDPKVFFFVFRMQSV